VAIADIGSNSLKFLVAEPTGNAAAGGAWPWRTVADLVRTTELVRDCAADGTLAAAAMSRTVQALVELTVATGIPAAALTAVGTAALRRAPNAAAFVARVRAALGCPVRILEGAEEAAYAFRGALTGRAALVAGAATAPVVYLCDVGGGSTEIVRGARAPGGLAAVSAASFDWGAVTLTDRFAGPDALSDARRRALHSHVSAALRARLGTAGRLSTGPLVAVGGTATSLAALELGLAVYDPARVHGASVARTAVLGWLDRLGPLTPGERARVAGLSAARARILPAGLVVLAEVAAWLGVERVIVSDHGVRHGVLALGVD